MTNYEKIQILLKEYDSLRVEILQRSSQRFTFLTLFGALGAYSFFVAESLNCYQVLVSIMSALFLFGVWFLLGKIIVRCSRRIAEIEKEINTLSDQVLLRWEHEHLGSKLLHKIFK